MRNTRWLILAPALLFALLPKQADATAEPGLNAVGYTIDDIPPLRSDEAYPTCGSELENNINRNFDGEPFAECGWDWFMVHYTGYITIPENTEVQFMVAADDGGTVKIGTHEFGTWNLKGCSWSQQVTLPLSGGTYPLDGWFFEAGGGTCYMLAWKLDDGYWEIVPEWAYTTTSMGLGTTTTTTVLDTTVPATTTTSTTVPETTTSTTVPETTTSTTVPETTTSTTVPETTTSTTVPETTTSVETPTSVLPSTTEAPSTTVEATTSTLEATTTTVLVETYVPPPVIHTMPPTTLATPEEEVPPSSVSTEPEVIEPEESLEEELPLPVEEPEVVDITSPATVPVQEPEDNPEEELVVEPEEELVVEPQDVVLDDPKSMLEALDVNEEPSPAVAAALATNPEVLAIASAEQAKQIFEALDLSEISETQLDALVEAVQDAPTEVREAFEETINVFGEGLDDYVPLGSSIPVGTRRTLIAVTAGMALAAAGTSMRKR